MSPALPPSALACWDEIVRRAAGVRLALFLDYDGTLAPIAPTPDEALLPEATREALARAAARFPVAILSGRAREDVAAKVGLPGLVYAGSHGFDLEGPGFRHQVGVGIPAEIAAAAERLRAAVGEIPGVILEPKGFSLSVHYRLAPQERVPEIERAVDAALAAHPALRKGFGKSLFELRPALDWDKGKALLWILRQLGSDGPGALPLLPLYIGDDRTDEDAFRVLDGRGIGIVVADGPGETLATYSLRDPAEVRELLNRLAALPGPQPESEHRRLQELYRTLVELATEGIWVVDPEARTTYANPRMAEMLGYAPEEMLGRSSFDFVHPDDLARSRQRWADRKAPNYTPREYRFLRKDGSTLWVDASSRPLYENGQVRGSLAMFTDIGERKRAEAEREALLARERQARAEAEEANRVKDEFLATVSHELRTPLNVIVSWVHLLRAQTPDPATLERGLATVERNVAAQMQIVEDILDVSRIIRGSLALTLEPVDLAAVALQAIESLRPGAEAKGVAIETRLPEEPEGPTVLGDPNRLRQVIWNLLSNAVKFTPLGGRIEITLETGGPEVRMTFADTGQGIAPEFLPHVFERFRQADGSTTRVHGGLGLGLAIVRHLIELHGGTVCAESDGLGRGARFTVTLPAPAAIPAAVREAASPG